MEGQDNLLDNNEDNYIPGPNELTSEDYQIIMVNFIPSLIYIIIISLILLCLNAKNPNFNEKNDIIHIIRYLQTLFVIYILYMGKSLFYYFLVTKVEIINNIFQILIPIIYFLIDISYYFSTISGYNSCKGLSLDYIINNLYKFIFIYSLIFVGIVHICLFFVSFFYILLSFIFSLSSFYDNEMGFIVQQGELPAILDKLLTVQKADKEHCKECYICLENIEKGQNIIILNCNKNHFFHSKCIRQWLRQNISCPLCRQQNII